MANYICDNCGAPYGFRYGSCIECTPEEVLNAKQEYILALSAACKEFDEQIMEQKRQFVEARTKRERDRFVKKYKQHAPPNYEHDPIDTATATLRTISKLFNSDNRRDVKNGS